MSLIVVSVSVLSLKFQIKSGSVLVVYRPPSRFEEMNEAIREALCKYENQILMGDLNIDIKGSNSNKDKLENLCDLFNLTNPVHSETCFMKSSKSIIDLILTNKHLQFQKTHVVEAGLSD